MMSTTQAWFDWALLSAVFASLTAIFAKIGRIGGNMKLRSLIVTILWVFMNSSLVLADEAVESFNRASAQSRLAQLDSGNYAKSWKEASAYFRGAMTEKGWVDALNGARKPWGK